MAPNYIISVRLDDGSLNAARQRLVELGRLAASVNVPLGNTGQAAQAVRQQAQAAAQAAAQVQKAQAAPNQSAATNQTASRQRAHQAVTASINGESKGLAELQQRMNEQVLAGTRWAGTLAHTTRELKTMGVATSDTSRALLLQQRTFRDIAGEVSIVAGKLALWTAAATAIGATVGVFSAVATSILDVNDAMTGLLRVTGETFDRDIASKAISDDIRDLQVSATDAATATFEMGKAFNDLSESIAAARTVLLASKIAELDLGPASQQLVAVATAFNLTGFQMEEILDRLNQQQNTLGVNIGKTLEGVARSAQVTQQAGGDIDNLIARTAVGVRFTGFAPETVSRAQSRLAQQILSEKGRGQIEAAIRGTERADLIGALIGTDGELIQDVDKVFNSLGKVFQELTGQQQNAIAESMTGGRQGGLSVITGSLLENFAIVQRQTTQSQNSQGSAFEELRVTLTSTREQIKGIGSEFQVLAANVENSGLLTVFGGLLVTLRQVLGAINDIVGAVNSITPDALQPLTGGLAGVLGASAIANRVNGRGVGGNIAGAFTPRPGGLGAQISGQDRALAAAETELAKLKVPIQQDVAALERLAAATARAEVSVAGFQEAAAKAGFSQQQAAAALEQSFRKRQEGLLGAKPGGALQFPPSQNPFNEKGFAKAQREAAILGQASPLGNAEQQRRDAAIAALRGLEVSTKGAATAEEQFARTTQLSTTVQREQQAAMRQLVLTTREASAAQQRQMAQGGILAKAGRGLASPGGAAVTSLGLGVGSQVAGRGDNTILQSILGTAALGSTAGLFGGPIALGAGVTGGAMVGLITGMKERQAKTEETFEASSNVIKEIIAEHDKLADLKNGVDIPSPTTAGGEELAASMSRLTENRVRLVENIFAQQKQVQDGATAVAAAGPVGGAVAFQAVKNMPTIVDDSMTQKAEEIAGDKQKLQTFLAEQTGTNREALEAAATLLSSDVGDQQNRRQLAGAIDASLAEIERTFVRDRGEAARQIKELATANDEVTVLAQAALSPEDFAKLGEANRANVASLLPLVSSIRGVARAFQADASRLQTAIQVLVEADLGSEDFAHAMEDATKAINDKSAAIVSAMEAGVRGPASSLTQASSNLANAAAVLRADPGSVDAQAAFVQAQQAMDAIRQRRVDEIEALVRQGRITEGEGAERSIAANAQALISQSRSGGRFAQRSDVFRAAVAEMNSQLATVAEQRVAAEEKRYDALIAGAKTDEEKARLLKTKAADIRSAGNVSFQAAGLATGTLKELAIATAGAGQQQAIVATGLAVSLIQYAQGLLAGFSGVAAAGDRILNGFGQILNIEALGGNIVSGALGRLQGMLGKIGEGAQGAQQQQINAAIEQLNNAAANIGQVPTGDAAEQASNEAAKAGVQALEDTAKDASDLVSARFEFLKALARGNEIKVAQLGVQEARAMSRFAKTAAERFRAKAAIVNAQKDLRSTILQERLAEIDFQLEMEQITQSAAVDRMRALMSLTKGNRSERRDLLLRIKRAGEQNENERSFGLPNGLPSLFDVKQAIGAGERQGGRIDKRERLATVGQRIVQSINNNNQITILVRNNADLAKVKKELESATGGTIKRNMSVGNTPGLF